MKKKIMDALQQKYKNLGLENEVFERVASSVETFITDETLDAFVAGAEGMLKSYQSMGDKHRAALAEAKKKQDEIQAQLDEALKKVTPEHPKKEEDEDRKSTRLNSSHTNRYLVCRLLLEKKSFFNDTATTEIYTLSHTTLFRSDEEQHFFWRASDIWLVQIHQGYYASDQIGRAHV